MPPPTIRTPSRITASAAASPAPPGASARAAASASRPTSAARACARAAKTPLFRPGPRRLLRCGSRPGLADPLVHLHDPPAELLELSVPGHLGTDPLHLARRELPAPPPAAAPPPG